MTVIHGETNDGKRRLVIVQLDDADMKKLVFRRDALTINAETRHQFPSDLELVITGIDIDELVKMLMASGTVNFKGTDAEGRKLFG